MLGQMQALGRSWGPEVTGVRLGQADQPVTITTQGLWQIRLPMGRAKAHGRLADAHVMAPCRLSAPTAMLVASTFPTDVSSSPMVERRLIP